MKKFILPLILILILTFTLIGNCADWLSGWDKRIELSIADYANDIGASVTWFPVTVFLTATQGEEVFTELTTDAEYLKVAFTKADGTTELYAEKELFDVSEQKGIYHVSRDGWTIDANTSIYMYYDKDHADNTTYIGAIGARTEVWDGNFKMIQHMVDDNGNVDDSTSNNNDGTKLGAGEPAEVAGKVGQGQDFDGINDKITVADSATLDFASGFTLEAVAEPDATDAFRRLIARYDATSTDGYFLDQYDMDTGHWRFYYYVSSVTKDVVSNVAPSGSFQYIVGLRDADGVMNIYVDGAVQTDTDTLSGAIDSNGILYLGKNWNDEGNLYDGIMDEVRISDTNRSAAWIKGTYNSLWDTLLTYGSEEIAVNVIFFGTNF